MKISAQIINPRFSTTPEQDSPCQFGACTQQEMGLLFSWSVRSDIFPMYILTWLPMRMTLTVLCVGVDEGQVNGYCKPFYLVIFICVSLIWANLTLSTSVV